MASVDFFYDIGSPYSYLAATQIHGLSQRSGTPIHWRPFLLGGVFKAVGNKAPATVPARARYMLHDLTRWAASYQIDIRFPSRFPMNTLLAMRALTAMPEQDRREASLALFTAYWVDDQDLTQPEAVASIIWADPVAAATDPAVKTALRATTDEAVARGAFGAPTLFVGDQMFFGNDRLHFAEAAMKS